jgi:hypothetical protein
MIMSRTLYRDFCSLSKTTGRKRSLGNELLYRLHCIFLLASVRYDTRVSAETDSRIQRLSAEALTAKTEDDVDRILEELRVALQEHVSLAKEKLREQVNSFA